MLQAEEMLKIKRMEGKPQRAGSIGDEDSLSEGSSNGICPTRGLMSSAVSAAIANGLANMNGSDEKFQRHRRVKLCVFCRNNGEPESVFKTHILKDANGRVNCPVLRAYTCPTCGASGDDAHTLKYCPATQPTIIYSPGIPDNGVKW
ncbi:nanos 1 [Oopsacas minuta]|uniref:Nanos 1 n=1 Tax=Oopsacas minuta TaxID=111878 RepID=A0AAV7JWG6_9METZ|nr:nanos 1 [Oopsacas minuta]